ncbi:MAG TPA: hypothetical protein PKW55_05295 [Spirochaetota bacterium]|nr:hypothetical protein [Spirochaetota bacterium]HOM37633.1 hypothetical protein [Spirochaetota bacterium]HPQ49396.1 hypothetical protein [Spirochaetota bacterium]
MKRNFIFKNGIFDIIIKNGFEIMNDNEIKLIVEEILGIKINKIELQYFIKRGIDKRDSLLFISGYELGKRHFLSFSQRKL